MITQNHLLNRLDLFIQSKWTYFFFFFASFILFSPFFIYFEHIVSTTDSVFGHFPNLFFGIEELKKGHISLWNPYLFGGIDLSQSMHHHILNPFNWLLALVPKAYLLHALTFIQFIEVALIGCFTFKTFLFPFKNRHVAFVSSLVVQLSGFTWFATSTFIGMEMFCLTTIFIYLIITFSKRRPLTNFIYMTLLTFGILVNGHVGYIVAFFFPIFIIHVIYHRSSFFTWKNNPTLILLLALFFGISMSLYRLIPILLAESIISSSLKGFFNVFILKGSCSYFLLTGFIPAIFGPTLENSIYLFQFLDLYGRHIQCHNLLYYGIATLFFFFISLCRQCYQKAFIIAWFTLGILLATFVAFQPISDIFRFILAPFTHTIVFRVGLSFLFFALAAFSFKSLFHTNFHISSSNLRFFLIVFGLFLCSCITFYLQILSKMKDIHLSLLITGKIILTMTFLFTLWLVFFLKIKKKVIKKITNLSFVLFTTLFIIIFFIKLFPLKKTFFYSISLYHFGLILWSFLIITLVRSSKLRKFKTVCLGLVFFCCLLILIFCPPGLYATTPLLSCKMILMSFPPFIILFTVYFEIFTLFKFKQLSPKTFCLFLSLLLVGELIFYLKIYSYSGGPPFTKKEALYPDIYSKRNNYFRDKLSKNKIVEEIDIKNYRINNPGNFLIYPYFNAFTSSFSKYQIRALGGIDSVVNIKLENYLKNFIALDPSFYARFGVLPIIENQLLKNLFGMRYDFPNTDNIIIHPYALPRFSLFSNYLVIKNPKHTLAHLKLPTFDPSQKVILDQNPYLAIKKETPTKALLPLPFKSTHSDHLALKLNFSSPKIILFNDAFNKGWHATWNKHPLPIFLANGYFMAVEIPSGKGVLEFTFHPKLFYSLVYLTFFLTGLLIMMIFYQLVSSKIRNYRYE